MAGNISKTIILELNGCCGCGKSTLVFNLEKLLKKNKIKYITLSKILDQSNTKWYDYALNSDRTLILRFLQYILSLHPIRMSRFVYFKHIMNLIHTIDENGKNKVILLDEGIVQWISSIAYKDKILNIKTIRNLLNEIIKNREFIIINCNLDYKETIFRIKKRKRNIGRIDNYRDDKQLLNLIKVQNSNLKKVRSIIPDQIKKLNINMQEEQTINADIILKQIKDKVDKMS